MKSFISKAPLTFAVILSAIAVSAVGAAGYKTAYRNYMADPLQDTAVSLVMRGIHDGIDPVEAMQTVIFAYSDPEGYQKMLDEENGLGSEEREGFMMLGEGQYLTNLVPAEQLMIVEEDVEPISYEIPPESKNEVVDAIDYGNTDRRYLAPAGTVFVQDTDGMFATNGTYYPLQQVEESYFSDALFIGDSRTDGLRLFSALKNKTTFFCKQSLNVFDLYQKVMPLYRPMKDGVIPAAENMTLLKALESGTYGKVYISIGVNELGYPNALAYYKKFRETVQLIRSMQPDAVIYVQGIMHVSGSYARKNSVYNNTNVVDRNRALASLANGRDIFYIDMNDYVCDENGDLREELTGDGVHLKASAYALWYDSILHNAAVTPEMNYDYDAIMKAKEEAAEKAAEAAMTKEEKAIRDLERIREQSGSGPIDEGSMKTAAEEEINDAGNGIQDGETGTSE